MKSKGIGVLLYPEDLLKIQRLVKPQYQFAVVLALSKYAETGELPTEADIGEAGMVAFEFIRDKVDDAVASLKRKREANQSAANSRWKHEKECEAMRNDANASERMHDDANSCHRSITETETETVTEAVYVTETKGGEGIRKGSATPNTDNLIFDLSPEEMRRNAELDERVSVLIKQCLPPWSEIKQRRVLEDVDKHGIEKVEAALIASAERTKGANSLPFYRTILANQGKPKPEAKKPEGEYQHRHYSDADFRAMEVDLDSLEEDTR